MQFRLTTCSMGPALAEIRSPHPRRVVAVEVNDGGESADSTTDDGKVRVRTRTSQMS